MITKGGWKLRRSDLPMKLPETSQGTTEVFYIRPEALILNPDNIIDGVDQFEVTIKTILFDGSNTKLSTIVNGSNEELLISLPQNAQFDGIEEGHKLNVGVHRDDVKCF